MCSYRFITITGTPDDGKVFVDWEPVKLLKHSYCEFYTFYYSNYKGPGVYFNGLHWIDEETSKTYNGPKEMPQRYTPNWRD
jgi:hypothetical protein